MARKSNKYGEYVAFLERSNSVMSVSHSKNVTRTNNRGTADGISYEKFGSDDKLPDAMIKAVWENSFMPQLLKTAQLLLHGGGLGLFRKRLVEGTETQQASILIEPAEYAPITDWMDSVHLDSYWRKATNQFVNGANVYTNFSLSILSKPVKLKIYDWTTVRAELPNEKTGQIDNYLIFGERVVNGEKVKVVQVPRYYDGIENDFPEFIYHGRDDVSGQTCYGVPEWYGALETIEVLNRIPKFHASGIDNGYNVKYHVKVPAIYLDQFATKEEKDKAWIDLQDQMDEQLCGASNVNKTVMTKFFIDPMTNKPLPGFEIVPLQQVMADEQYLKLEAQFRTNATGSVGINLDLANIPTGGKLSSSASELRTAALLHILMRTPIPRSILLKPIRIAMQMMGFPSEYYIGVKDFEFQKLDTNPNGARNVTNSANAPA
jgi:hypothetical protein